MELLTVGEVAGRTGVPATTLRYYDAIGLLVPDRLANGHRRYSADALEQLELVRLCQALGLSLDEITAILGPDGGEARRSIATRKVADLEKTLAQLAAARAVLTHFADCRHTAADAAECRHIVRSAWAAVSPRT